MKKHFLMLILKMFDFFLLHRERFKNDYLQRQAGSYRETKTKRLVRNKQKQRHKPVRVGLHTFFVLMSPLLYFHKKYLIWLHLSFDVAQRALDLIPRVF